MAGDTLARPVTQSTPTGGTQARAPAAQAAARIALRKRS